MSKNEIPKLINLKKFVNLDLGTIVQLVYKESGKGFVKNIRKNCKVIGSYDFHLLLLDIDENVKISITKATLITDAISIVKIKNAEI